MILLDTHPLVWFTQGDEKLGNKARQIIDRSLEAGEAMVSPISFWEVSMLDRKGRIALGQTVHAWKDAVLGVGTKLTRLSPEIAVSAGQLSGGLHGDPADRLIVATARDLGCPVLTADRKILAYGKEGHVRTIDAKH